MAGRDTEIAGVGTDPPLPAGAVIDGRYRVIAELGAGGMGRVYEAEHMFIRRRMALKLLRRGLADAPEAAARLVQEATLAGQVPHAAVVRVFDCAVLPGGQVYLAMELLRGESLEQALRRPGSAAEIVPLLAEVARGLAAVHRVGVVHRDIKPGNIFLARGESGVQAKLLDFGVAKLLPGASGLADDAVQTQAGAVLGTPYYLAPEQARGAAIDGRADLYSLGVIVYEMLTGELPFVGDSYMEILAQHVRTPPLDPRQAAPARAIPDGLARLTMRLLAKDPDERVADGDALADEMMALLASEGPALERLRTGGDGAGDGVGAVAEAGTQQLGEAGTLRLEDASGVNDLVAGTGDMSSGTGARGSRGDLSAATGVGGSRGDLSSGTGAGGSRGDPSFSAGAAGSRADMPSNTGAVGSRRDLSSGTGAGGSRGDLSFGAGTAGARVDLSAGTGASRSRGSLFVGAAAAAAIASAAIGWTVVRAANHGEVGAAEVRSPEPAVPETTPAPVPVVAPPRPVASPVVAPPRPVAAIETPAPQPPRPIAGAGKPGKKRPRDGGTTATPAAKKTPDPQLKPDVYDE